MKRLIFAALGLAFQCVTEFDFVARNLVTWRESSSVTSRICGIPAEMNALLRGGRLIFFPKESMRHVGTVNSGKAVQHQMCSL